jgi:hypothetical protein
VNVPPRQPPGWYPDPSGTGQRYWDGNAWTSQFTPGSPPDPNRPPAVKKGLGTGRVIAIVAAGLILLVVIVVVIVAAVGSKTIKASSAESFLRSNLPGSPQTVKCPSGVEEKAGKSFDCHVTYPDGSKLTVTVHQTDSSGHVQFGPNDIRRG